MKNSTVFLTLLIASTNMQGMESHAQRALQAKKYNEGNQIITFVDNLIVLPSELLDPIMNFHYFSELSDEITQFKYHQAKEGVDFIGNANLIKSTNLVNKITDILDAKSLEYNIKRYMMFSGTCTHFNKTLTPQTIGALCKHYSQDTKNKVWQRLMAESTGHFSVKSLPAVILICAGATDNTSIDTLLCHITMHNKVQQAEILFQRSINPNLRYKEIPIFFNAKTKEMIQTFINYGVDINAETTNNNKENVLWDILHDPLEGYTLNRTLNRYGSELMEFYLLQGVNPKKLRDSDKSCLLHEFADPRKYNPSNIHILKKCELLLNAMPKMVNAKNIYGETPLDITKTSLQQRKEFEESRGENEYLKQYGLDKSDKNENQKFEIFATEFVTLFRNRGGKTTYELEKEKLEKESDCIIF